MLEDGNARLKKLLAEAMLDMEPGQKSVRWTDFPATHAEGCGVKKMVTPVARREAAAYLRTVHGVSERRACEVLQVDRSSVR